MYDEKWVTKKPNVLGYYWTFENLDSLDADVILIYFDGNKCYGQGVSFGINHFSHWMGPLNVPIPPKVNGQNKDSFMNIENIKRGFDIHKVLMELNALYIFQLAVYHKFVSDDPVYKTLAEKAFDEYLYFMRETPPKLETIEIIKNYLDNFTII